jgi:hypothetical protein
MTYRLGMRDSGWEIVNTISRTLATFGGLPMEGLTIEEAHVMKDLIEAYDRGNQADRTRDRPPSRGFAAGTDGLAAAL